MISLRVAPWSPTQMETSSLESGSKTTFERCIYINVPASRLWEAITSPTLIDEYFILPTASFDLFEGGHICFGATNNKIIDGVIDLIEAPSRLGYSFAFTHYPDEPASRVVYMIEEIGPNLSCLYLRHENLLLTSRTFQDVTIGWDRILSEMKTFLETGRGLNWPEDPE